jgi:uncharacterized protein (UPF0147 family)
MCNSILSVSAFHISTIARQYNNQRAGKISSENNESRMCCPSAKLLVAKICSRNNIPHYRVIQFVLVVSAFHILAIARQYNNQRVGKISSDNNESAMCCAAAKLLVGEIRSRNNLPHYQMIQFFLVFSAVHILSIARQYNNQRVGKISSNNNESAMCCAAAKLLVGEIRSRNNLPHRWIVQFTLAVLAFYILAIIRQYNNQRVG